MSLPSSVLITTLLDTDITPNELVVYFDTIILLIKKYWKKIYTPTMMSSIKEADISVYTILQLLLYYKKQKISDISGLSRGIQQGNIDYMPRFTVSAPEAHYQETIKKNIKKNFPTSQIRTSSNIDLWVSISWEWWHYKRNLDQDIQKILW